MVNQATYHCKAGLTVNAAYYRGAMGILLVYDVTDEASFNNVRNWMKNIETHASSTVNKVSFACSLICLDCSTSTTKMLNISLSVLLGWIRHGDQQLC